MENNYFSEAFKALDELNEEVFDISINDGFEKAKDFVEEPVDNREDEIIIDPLAETEEDLEKDYIGKVILQCPICQSMVYKAPDEVIIDEEQGLANLEDICPMCQSEDGFKIIGEIKEYCGDDDCEEAHEEEDSIEIEATGKKGFDATEKAMDEFSDSDSEDLDEAKKLSKSGNSNLDKIKRVLGSLKESIKTRKHVRLEDLDDSAATSIEDAQKWVDYDMKKYGKISGRTNRLIKKAGFQIIKDDHGDYEVTAGKFESMKEDFERVDIETDKEKMSMTAEENGKVIVTTEPKEEVEIEDKEEVIEPVSDGVEAEFKTEDELKEEPTEEYTDIDFDEFEEDDFDSLGEGFLKKVYENVDAFKTTAGAINGNKLKLEGLITFKSGKQAKTNFVFEAYKATKTGKLKFIGENKQFAKGKKSFTLSGRADGKKLVCESLTYNFVGKSPNGESKRLYGTVRK